MSNLQNLREKNPKLNIMELSDPAFAKYGRVHSLDCTQELLAIAEEHIPMPEKAVVYRPGNEHLEADEEARAEISGLVYGGMPVQMGFCNGYNSAMNAYEYHKGSELIIPGTDVVLLVADYRCLKFGDKITLDSAATEVFFQPKGTPVELFPTVLHFAPVQADANGFKTIVVLPQGTNHPFTGKASQKAEGPMLLAVNKWLISHPEMGAGYVGITGENIKVAF